MMPVGLENRKAGAVSAVMMIAVCGKAPDRRTLAHRRGGAQSSGFAALLPGVVGIPGLRRAQGDPRNRH
jgi:hypothetical protein